ncbi:MAG TPA: type II toxin-antitoxin system Phd/YefM family antitoxin [Desulfuromonadales bacterium]|nr:type II toxin-antitoxin system Phd/YefM family antitoxin [Desulfuromonadales bacterium]
MQSMTTMDLRKNLGQILDMVAEKNESVTISRANKPLAVILSIAEYEEKVQKKNRGQRLETLSGAMDDWRERNRSVTKQVDAVQAVRESRDSR